MMNRTMKLLMISDIFVLAGFGLIQPILAIFINDGLALWNDFGGRTGQHHLSANQVTSPTALPQAYR